MKQITTFWKYFKKNEKEILNAILLGINTEEILSQITTKLDYVSKRIKYIIKAPKTINDKFIIIFTWNVYRKLFPKIITLENQAPSLVNFTAAAIVKHMEDNAKYKNGTDGPLSFRNYTLKISELQIALLDYNIETKQIKINIYLPDYNELKHFEDLKHNINWIVAQIIGEIAFQKHIKQILLAPLQQSSLGLLSIIELPDYLEYLYRINSRKKTTQT